MGFRMPTEKELRSHPLMKHLERVAIFCNSLFLSSLFTFFAAHLFFNASKEFDDMIAPVIIWSAWPSIALMMLEETIMTLVTIHHSFKADLANRARICIGLLVASIPAVYVAIIMRLHFISAPHETADFIILIFFSTFCLPFIFCTGWKLSGPFLRLAGRIMDCTMKRKREGSR